MSGGCNITDGLEWGNLLNIKKIMLEEVLFSPQVTEPDFIAAELERRKMVSAYQVSGARFIP